MHTKKLQILQIYKLLRYSIRYSNKSKDQPNIQKFKYVAYTKYHRPQGMMGGTRSGEQDDVVNRMTCSEQHNVVTTGQNKVCCSETTS